jgi:hypothetical protein
MNKRVEAAREAARLEERHNALRCVENPAHRYAKAAEKRGQPSGGCKTITWTPEKLAAFKLVAKVGERKNSETFLFEGHEFLVGYAKYLIEYLETGLIKLR